MVEWLERLFPQLHGTSYQVISSATDAYNCVAWAAGVTKEWWWPVGVNRQLHWLAGVPLEETLPALSAAFATLGYVPCQSEELEAGQEKVALFADARGVPTHAAR